MTSLLDHAVERLRGLPADRQDDLARMLLQLAGDEQPPLPSSPDQEASFATSLEQARNGAFATDEQVRAIWAKHGL